MADGVVDGCRWRLTFETQRRFFRFNSRSVSITSTGWKKTKTPAKRGGVADHCKLIILYIYKWTFCIYKHFFFRSRPSVFLAENKKKKNKKGGNGENKENDTPSEPDIVLVRNCFWPRAEESGGDHSPPADTSPPPRHCDSLSRSISYRSTWFARLAIRNHSFVTNKDKCYKRPPPLAILPSFSPTPLAVPQHTPTSPHHYSPYPLPITTIYCIRLTESRHLSSNPDPNPSPPSTANELRRADIKRQIKIRCYLSKLWTGSNHYSHYHDRY